MKKITGTVGVQTSAHLGPEFCLMTTKMDENCLALSSSGPASSPFLRLGDLSAMALLQALLQIKPSLKINLY